MMNPDQTSGSSPNSGDLPQGHAQSQRKSSLWQFWIAKIQSFTSHSISALREEILDRIHNRQEELIKLAVGGIVAGAGCTALSVGLVILLARAFVILAEFSTLAATGSSLLVFASLTLVTGYLLIRFASSDSTPSDESDHSPPTTSSTSSQRNKPTSPTPRRDPVKDKCNPSEMNSVNTAELLSDLHAWWKSNIPPETKDLMKTNAKEAAHHVREHPLPYALVGAGIGCLAYQLLRRPEIDIEIEVEPEEPEKEPLPRRIRDGFNGATESAKRAADRGYERVRDFATDDEGDWPPNTPAQTSVAIGLAMAGIGAYWWHRSRGQDKTSASEFLKRGRRAAKGVAKKTRKRFKEAELNPKAFKRRTMETLDQIKEEAVDTMEELRLRAEEAIATFINDTKRDARESFKHVARGVDSSGLSPSAIKKKASRVMHSVADDVLEAWTRR